MITTFKDIAIWQEAMNLVEVIYQQTKTFPIEEKYSLTTQIKKAVISIPANIAEGIGRRSREDYLHCLTKASGSTTELETQILIAERLRFLTKEQAEQVRAKLQSVGNRLSALRKSLAPHHSLPVHIPR